MRYFRNGCREIDPAYAGASGDRWRLLWSRR